MNKYQGALFIIAVCGIVFLIIAIKTNSNLILNFLLRSISGSLIIYIINMIFLNTQYRIEVGLNQYTVLTTGILGFPGVILLYGIKIYMLL